ncbi:Multi antimicrobial extrusion protein (Na(+)/drug antiporter), MATE family of MDR efflux pump [Lachnospiraceae bacterium TWA4]|nr:Multi antimicrobial extrusion protein (Na(+)/drug antiporter), MATE family of MDR efflux pump [Lachnospiraceae bacterium TWA4]
MDNTLTSGNLFKTMARFSVPYLISSFLQTFYGLADLFITGHFNGAAQVTAVSVGSQITHMLTVIIVGLAMGTTVSISHAIGASDKKRVAHTIGNSVIVFAIMAIVTMILLLFNTSNIVYLLNTPTESFNSAKSYLIVCFIGVPFIVAYNVISSIFRGLGDTKSPMIFVGIAGVINVGLDYVLIGPFSMGATGAAIATVLSQAVSVILALIAIRRLNMGITLSKECFQIKDAITKKILYIGVPIACQDGLIQVSFLIITMIANSRGLEIATAVGIVEKVISFLFLVPSAMLSTVSAITAQCVGAGLHERGQKTLKYGVSFCIGFGAVVILICQFMAPAIVSLFVQDEPQVVIYGAQYLRSYSADCLVAGIHFCFSGYFSAYGKSMYSFIHNVTSIIVVRIPGTYLASILFPATLFPMGMAAPGGSLLSVIICLILYFRLKKRDL